VDLGRLADPQLTGGAVLWSTLIVAAGAVVPVIPTGAAVSATAPLAERGPPLTLLLVLTCGAAGAWVGDLAVYGLCLHGGEALARRLCWVRGGLGRVAEELRDQGLTVLVVSRLIPGGRVPVFLAAASAGYAWRRFAVADLAPCALWSSVYGVLGLAGRSLFPEPRQGLVATIGLVVALSWTLARLRARHDRRTPRADARPRPSPGGPGARALEPGSTAAPVRRWMG